MIYHGLLAAHARLRAATVGFAGEACGDARALVAARESLDIAERIDSAISQSMALHFFGRSLALVGDAVAAASALERAQPSLPSRGPPRSGTASSCRACTSGALISRASAALPPRPMRPCVRRGGSTWRWVRRCRWSGWSERPDPDLTYKVTGRRPKSGAAATRWRSLL